MLFQTLSATTAEVFTYIGYVIVALIALMLMIIVHELGHYTAGKILGFRIDEFAIGFGPALFKHTNKKTGEAFTIRPLPIGGFCAFHGEDEDGKSDPTAFNNQKAWKRLIVLFSGAMMNFLSAIFIITIYFSAYGQILPTVLVSKDNVTANQVFEVGDVILSINGKQVNIMVPEDVDNAFAKVGNVAKFTVLRGGKTVKLEATKGCYTPFAEGDFIESINGEALLKPIPYSELYLNPAVGDKTELKLVVVKYNEDGDVAMRTNVVVFKGINADEPSEWYSHGFGITRGLARTKLPFFLAFGRSFSFCFFIVFKILASLGALLTGQIGLESAGGTITVIGTIAQVSALGFDSFLYVVAIISANLAVMNLLPLPALDGSRMVFTLIEMVFRKPVPRKIEAVIHTVGLVVLLLLAVFLDVFHLVHV
ncbi:MAG: RIP metalloprotease RseP [Clostridia bacterium]